MIIGNEILSGRTQDANLSFLAQGLNEVGVRLREARVIPDDAGVIVATVNEVRRAFDYVFTTGGIGPTHDDITAQCVAEGAECVVLLPYFLSAGVHVRRDLAAAREDMAARFPQVDFRLAEPLGRTLN